MKVADMLLLVKCFDNKMVKLPFNLIIFPLIKPQEANQQKKYFTNLHNNNLNISEDSIYQVLLVFLYLLSFLV